MYYKDHRGIDICLGVLVGGALAALTTLLFTTKGGKDVQKKVKDTFEDLTEGAKEKVSALKEKAEDLTNDAKEKASSLKEKAEESLPKSKKGA